MRSSSALMTALNLLAMAKFLSRQCNGACKIWRKKPAADETWPLFKTCFAEEHRDLKEQQKVSTSQANAVLDVSNALDNLAMAATTTSGHCRSSHSEEQATCGDEHNPHHPAQECHGGEQQLNQEEASQQRLHHHQTLSNQSSLPL